jgi:hypothetical protein
VVNNAAAARDQANPSALWITSTHKKVNAINRAAYKSLEVAGSYSTRVVAQHRPNAPAAPAATRAQLDHLYSHAGGFTSKHSQLPTYVDLAVGTRVRLMSNVCPELGLFQGCMGTIRYVLYGGEGPPEDLDADGKQVPTKSKVFPTRFCDLDRSREIPTFLVQFDGEDNDDHPLVANNHSVSTTMKRLLPICAVPGRFPIPGTQYVRWQIPLAPAHARTIHSSQGLTAFHGAVVEPGGPFFAGDYVAMSRIKKLIDLFLLAPIQARYFQRAPESRALIDQEYERLRALFHQV